MIKNKITTIKIEKSTKERLDHLKKHEKESYEEIITKILNILNICKKSPSLAARILRDIDRSKSREKLIENPEKLLRKKQPVQSPTNQQPRLVQRLPQSRMPIQRQQINSPMQRREI